MLQKIKLISAGFVFAFFVIVVSSVAAQTNRETDKTKLPVVEAQRIKVIDVNTKDPCNPFFQGTVFIPCGEELIGAAYWDAKGQNWEVALDKKRLENINRFMPIDRGLKPRLQEGFVSDIGNKALKLLEGIFPKGTANSQKPPREINLYLNLKTQEVGIRITF